MNGTDNGSYARIASLGLDRDSAKMQNPRGDKGELTSLFYELLIMTALHVYYLLYHQKPSHASKETVILRLL